MSKYKESILQEFDRLIEEFKTLIIDKSQETFDRLSHKNTYETPEDRKERFYEIRSQTLELLRVLPSEDDRLVRSIKHLRSIEPTKFNIERALENLRSLKSDFSADMLNPVKSNVDQTTIVKLLLREALLEVKYLQPPYPKEEIDRIEKLINRAVRQAFGEESSQYKEIYTIFHPMPVLTWDKIIIPEESLRKHIENWEINQQELLNSLEISIGEYELLQKKETSSSLKNEDVVDSPPPTSTKRRFLDEPRAIVVGSVITGLCGLIGIFITVAVTISIFISSDAGNSSTEVLPTETLMMTAPSSTTEATDELESTLEITLEPQNDE